MLRLHLLGCCEVGLGTCKGVLKSWRSWSCSSRVSTSGARVTQRSSILTLRCRAHRSAAPRGRLIVRNFRLLRQHVGRRVLPDAEQVVLHPSHCCSDRAIWRGRCNTNRCESLKSKVTYPPKVDDFLSIKLFGRSGRSRRVGQGCKSRVWPDSKDAGDAAQGRRPHPEMFARTRALGYHVRGGVSIPGRCEGLLL